MDNLLLQTSLIAAFIAGMVALFAPCCITFLLPAYLGSVFKEKERVLLMTLVFGLGIFVVLLPAVLGVAFVSRLLFRYHDTVYILGGVVMILVSLIAFLGIKLPMPSLPSKNNKRVDVFSIFTLGIFSGITSACCAPVLIGILTLTFLSPSFVGALLVGAMYVLGMVTPLLFISLFLTDKMPKVTFLRKQILEVNILGKTYSVIVSNAVAALAFFVTGVLTLFLTLTGKISSSNMGDFTRMIQMIGGYINSLVGESLFLNIAFLALVIFLLYKIFKKI